MVIKAPFLWHIACSVHDYLELLLFSLSLQVEQAIDLRRYIFFLIQVFC